MGRQCLEESLEAAQFSNSAPHLTDGSTHVLYSFTGGADGGEPYKGVTIDRRGNLYGTAVTGGSGSCEGGCGVVYKLTKSGGTWTQTVIHAFTGGDDGSGPGARVTVDRSGDVYGMAPTGGTYGVGTIYKIHPHAGSWDFQVIHTFTGGEDGATGSAGRMLLKHGRLYGAATVGGLYGSGVVFELTPTAQLGNGISGRCILFTGNPTEVFLTARYSALLRVKSTGPLITVVENGIGAVYELSPRSDWGMGRQSDLQLPNRKRRQQSDQQSCSRRSRQSLWHHERRRFREWHNLQASSYWRRTVD